MINLLLYLFNGGEYFDSSVQTLMHLFDTVKLENNQSEQILTHLFGTATEMIF